MLFVAIAVAGCATASDSGRTGGDDTYVNLATYKQMYRKTVATFPEKMPPGVTFPVDPPAMDGLIGIGNGPGMAYFFWNCAWMDVFMNATDTDLRETSLVELRKFPTTAWGAKYYDDSSGAWATAVKSAELGDLTDFREFYQSDCDYYRQVRSK
jgi:hypothetical protein